MSELNIALVVIGGLVLGTGLLSRPIRSTVLSLPMLALVTGVALGPAGVGLLHPDRWGSPAMLLEEAARLTLAIGLMGVALRLPPEFPLRSWRALAVLLGLVMPLMGLCSGLLTYWFLDLPLLIALLVGVVVSPTDPIVATSIVTGQVAEANLPERVRHLLSAESGANDGLAYPLVLLPVLLLTRPADEVWAHWFGRVILWEVGAAALCGGLLGVGLGKLLRWAEARQTIESPSFLAYTVALSLLALGVAHLLGTDGILAVFVTGLAFDRVVGARERAQEEQVQEAFNQFFTLPIFTLFGLMLPWESWQALGWSGLGLGVAVLLLRRLPAMLLCKPVISQWRDWKDACFAGWFGPIGIAALFYAMQGLRHTEDDAIWTVGSLLVCASIVAHGITAAPLTKLYGRHQHRSQYTRAPQGE